MVEGLLPFRDIGSLVRPRQDLSEGLHVVRDADEWARHWAKSSSGSSFGPPAAAVDWQTEMCVVAALGTRPSGGYQVLINTIEVVGGGLTVVAWEIRPGNCVVTCALTHPFHAVATPARTAPASLIKLVAEQDCEATDY
ncbi:hypothetical protein GCM10010112_26960 [Actinoplanes lobatus]|uniref:PrcB C-terminal domain-containing protein n=1 Tax=Actinoplanes lobatus TaxID=113568 RepID=A0A7W7HJL3_9ACTN|nr:protease complex subunit PrcB family protein [Actinoplanes lobatus]MBB4751738.1 hypothetical protein [Actinoplanes lobatus]GGN65525.1 hypothetical protein GCM10010112_26960 [Actinoplanes lobatus]GIE43320.1 hypothetical protein Alo02nite_62180 [Actinoplanes lobatus]